VLARKEGEGGSLDLNKAVAAQPITDPHLLVSSYHCLYIWV